MKMSFHYSATTLSDEKCEEKPGRGQKPSRSLELGLLTPIFNTWL